MSLPAIDPARARELLLDHEPMTVLVVGDVMVDRFIVGQVTRISPEAPVPVVRFRREHTRLGGAANVANNLAALGVHVLLVGTVGRDAGAGRLRALIADAGIGTDGLVEDADRPTVEKVRIVTERNQQVARIDYEEDLEIGDAVEDRIVEHVGRLGATARVLLVSDYLKGTITGRVMDAMRRLKTNRRPLLVDPKIPHLGSYAGATLVTPNHLEAEAATGRRIRNDADARDAAKAFRSRAACDAVLITRGEHGMWLSGPDAEGAVPATAREVADVTGAGDTVVATLAVALGAGATLAEAAVLANHGAGIVVGKFGAATVTVEELLAQITGAGHWELGR
jgi:D-beta-D-heptose 7-phosphate kinase/D-beta-D-heptose 1-phosphate adenosyltransferase